MKVIAIYLIFIFRDRLCCCCNVLLDERLLHRHFGLGCVLFFYVDAIWYVLNTETRYCAIFSVNLILLQMYHGAHAATGGIPLTASINTNGKI